MPPRKKKTEWGFLFIADRVDDSADGELLSRIIQLIKTATLFKEKNKIQIIFCLRATKEFKKKVLDELVLQNAGVTIIDEPEPGKLMIYESPGNTIRNGNYDITMSKGISRIIKDFYKGKINAQFNGLITWGHGGVYSFFPRAEENINQSELLSLQKYKMVSGGDNYRNYSYYIKKYEHELASENYLNMGELKSGIQKGLKKKMDIVVMSHCYMAYYETANMMSFCSKLWIAAMGYVQFNSLEFAEKLNDIHQNVSKTLPLQFAKNLLKKNQNTERVDSFMIYDVRKYYILRKILYAMAGRLLSEIKKTTDICTLKGIREACNETPATTSYHVVDLFELCEIIANSKSNGSKSLINRSTYSLASQILKQPKAVIIPVFEEEYKGLAIHFPGSKYVSAEISERLGTIPYKKRLKKWEFFVLRYLEALVKKPCP